MAITLPKLPIEVFLAIASYLSDIDKQSLRHANRDFRRILPALRPKSYKWPFLPNRPHLIFVRRLFKDNLFACRGDVGICPTCANVTLKANFFKSGVYADNHKICIACEKEFIEQLGLKEPVHGARTYRCWLCSTYGMEVDMHWHDNAGYRCEWDENEGCMGVGRTKAWCCAVCHMGMCHSAKCEGWPPGFVAARENRNHFRGR